MNIVQIKPLSVNKAWQGRRFKTPEYKKYERDVLTLLPGSMVVPEGELELRLKFGFSNKLCDFDNPVKPFVDCLQKKYGFNDKRIRRCVIDIDDTLKKGHEFIGFELTQKAA